MPPLSARIAITVTACCLAMSPAACNSSHSGDHAHSSRSDDKPVITGEPAAYNAADIAFAHNATAREEQAISMSRLVPEHSNNSDVIAFAAKTESALQLDTQVLKALRAQWKESQDNQTGSSAAPATPADPSANPTVAKLDSLHGSDFDTLWLKSMIELFQGTIDLANAEVTGGKNVDAVSLARQIVTARQADVGQMRQLLAG